MPFLVNKFTPVKVATFKGMDKCFCSCNVGRDRNVVNVAKAKKGCIVSIGVLIHRIAEEKKKVNFVAGDSGSDLFTAAVASAEKT